MGKEEYIAIYHSFKKRVKIYSKLLTKERALVQKTKGCEVYRVEIVNGKYVFKEELK